MMMEMLVNVFSFASNKIRPAGFAFYCAGKLLVGLLGAKTPSVLLSCPFVQMMQPALGRLRDNMFGRFDR